MGKMIIKTLSSRFAVAFFAIATGLLTQATVASQDLQRRDLPFLQAEVNAGKTPVKVALPTLAQVFLKGNSSKIGQVIVIDSQGQKLVLKHQSGQTLSVPLSQVEKVVFKDGNVFYRSDGRMAMRGNGNEPVGKQDSWVNIPLNDFKLGDANKGQGVVTLGPPVVDEDKLEGIRLVARNSLFVVDEMQFNLPKKTMMIKATPY
jgi:hypothetical protein